MESVFVSVSNIAIVGIFAKVAMHFDKWWIILFSLLAIASYREDKTTKKYSEESDQTDGGAEE